MSKFNTAAARTRPGRGPTETTGPATTFEGGPGYTRTWQSDLFLLAVTNMVGESTFYEDASDRDQRYTSLIRRGALEDPVWTANLLRWLRRTGNMRTAPIVGACEYLHARHAAGWPPIDPHQLPAWTLRRGLDRSVVDAVQLRPDEPAEMVAYWLSRHGRTLPKPLKRGLADACRRLYNERTLLKYDTPSHAVRFADVLELAHPAPRDDVPQGALFQYALDRRHNRTRSVDDRLTMIRNNNELRGRAATDPTALLDYGALLAAGMTWEDALSLAGPNVDKAALWTALIPHLGYMAAIRNLRNIDQAGVPDPVAAALAARIANPDEVRRSKQFPFRFLSAYRAAPSLRWGHPLDQALQHSLTNIPALAGRSLVLVDTSGSMTSRAMSKRSTVTPVEAAAIFGVSLAAKGQQVDLHGFADGVFTHDVPAGGSVLKETERLVARVGEVGCGTNIAGAVNATYSGHDRVFVITDMQTVGRYIPQDGWFGMLSGVTARQDVFHTIPATTPVYAFNLGGYAATAINTSQPNRIELGGLNDATFRLIPIIEAGRDADWPWTCDPDYHTP